MDEGPWSKAAQPGRFDRHESYLSVQAHNWTMAMQPHVKRLIEITGHEHPAPIENAHATAVSLLAILVVDSLATRAAYMIRDLGGWAARQRGMVPIEEHPRQIRKFIVDLLGNRRVAQPTAAAVDELYALRGVLAHSYLWDVRIAERDEPPEVAVIAASLSEGFGDAVFERVRDGLRSRTLRLNLVPSLVGRADAATVLEVSWAIIDFLSNVPGASVSGAALPDWRVGPGKLATFPEGAALLRVGHPSPTL